MNPAKKKSDHEVQPRDRETRAQILAAAQELFLNKGFNGVSMKDVAETVQITSAALYYHFPDGKRELFMSVISSLLEESVQGAIQVVSRVQGIRERLTALTQHLFTLPFDRFALLARDIREQLPDLVQKRALFLHTRDTLLQTITGIFQQAMESGEISKDIPASVLAALFEGMITSALRNKHLAIGGIEQYDAHQLARFIIDVLLDGIGVSRQEKVQ